MIGRVSFGRRLAVETRSAQIEVVADEALVTLSAKVVFSAHVAAHAWKERKRRTVRGVDFFRASRRRNDAFVRLPSCRDIGALIECVGEVSERR